MQEEIKEKPSGQRKVSIDILKIVMAFLVVGLHGNNFLADISPLLFYFFREGIGRIAVPMFLLINGFYFFDIKSKKQFFNLIKRLFILYLIWVFLYYSLWHSPGSNILKTVKQLLIGPLHLWYLIESLFAFIMFWVIRRLNYKILFSIFVICSITGICLQYMDIYSLQKITMITYRNFLFFCFPFIFIGYSLNKFSVQEKKMKWNMLLLLSIIILIVEVSSNYIFGKGSFDILVSLYFICPLLFLIALNINIYSNKKTLALYSTGVYLVHWYILKLPIVNIFKLQGTPRIIFVFILSLILSWFLIQVKKKFKYIL
ncbi:acyltransferase family protein [Chryseobacterium sp. 'Rf worker isolate 10']|uniref:acyltransferase family protein n=1 Tax=Chryseobacterium sp. 'Rf worker isolate 10' TaxID=2887348 RepID=UPI003D6E6BDD